MSLAHSIKKSIGLPTNMVIGVVSSINADGTLNVDIRGTVVESLLCLSSYVSPHAGDNVEILSFGSTQIVLGCASDSSQSFVPAVQSGLELISFTTLGSFTQSVTYPIAFDTTPSVAVNIKSGAGVTARWGARAISINSTGFTMFVFAGGDGTGTATWSNIPVNWVAVRD